MLVKNVLNSIKKKPIRLIGISFLVIFASILFVALSYTIKGIEDQLYDYVEEYNQEDFWFDMNPTLSDQEIGLINQEYNTEYDTTTRLLSQLKPDEQTFIINKRIQSLESEYKVTIEPREYKQFTEQNEQFNKTITIRYFTNNDTINKTYLEEGMLATNLNEITVNKSFAKGNGLSIGDELKLNNRTYQIVGYVYFVDYIYPQISQESLLFDSSKQILAQVSQETFNQIEQPQSVYYSGVWNEEGSIDDIDSPFVWNLNNARSEFRTGAIYSEIDSNKAMIYALSGAIIFLAVIIIGIIVHKSIQTEKTQIGVIKALGYSNFEITRAYMIYPIITSLLGITIGYGLGFILARPLIEMYQTYYQMPVADISHDVMIILSSIIFPFILLNGFGLIVIYFIVRKKPLDLIRITTNNKVNFFVKGINQLLKRFSFKTRFKYSVATRGIGKLFVTLIGVLIASVYLVFAVSGVKSFDTIITESFGSSTYDYQISFGELTNEPVKEEFDRYTMLPTKIKLNNQEEEASLIGLEQNLNLFALENEEGKSLINEIYKDERNAVITSMLATLRQVGLHDEITIITPDQQEKTLKIVGITENYMNPYLYTQIKTVNGYIGIDENHYNGLWTDEKLNRDDIVSLFDKTSMIETMEEMMTLAKTMIYVMIIVAVILSLIVLIMIANFNIEDNFKMISFLKVIGYEQKEISSMVMNIYLPIVMIGYLLSVPLTLFSLNALMKLVGEEMNLVIPFEMNLVQVLIGAVIMIVTYYGSLLIAKRKLTKVPLQETLKYNE